MNSLQRMNEVIAYIEENLTDQMSYERAAQIAACPIHLFQRFFAYITGISLSEYIRRRRLTLAAFELQQTNEKIIDIALKYGYDSHSSFSRAFRNFHGIAPSQCTSTDVPFTIYPKLFFPEIDGDFNAYYRKGADKMDQNNNFLVFEGLRYRIDFLTLPKSLKFIGLSTGGDYSLIEVYHHKYADTIKNKSIPAKEIAMWQNLTTDNGDFDYVYGAVVDSLDGIPDGLVGADTGFTKFSVITINCDTINELFDDATFQKVHHNFAKLLPSEYKNCICPPSPDSKKGGFGILAKGKKGDTSLIEIYPHDLFEKIELNFYVPLQP